MRGNSGPLQLFRTGRCRQQPLRRLVYATVDTGGFDAEPSMNASEIGCVFSPTLTNIHAGRYWAEHPEQLDDPEIRAALEYPCD